MREALIAFVVAGVIGVAAYQAGHKAGYNDGFTAGHAAGKRESSPAPDKPSFPFWREGAPESSNTDVEVEFERFFA